MFQQAARKLSDYFDKQIESEGGAVERKRARRHRHTGKQAMAYLTRKQWWEPTPASRSTSSESRLLGSSFKTSMRRRLSTSAITASSTRLSSAKS